MREKEVITEWNSTVFDSLLGFFHPLFSLQRFLPAVLIFSRVGQLRISTLPSLALGACCIPALPRHGSELCRRFLPGLQVTLAADSPGEPGHPALLAAAIPRPAGCSSRLHGGTDALGRGAAQHGSGASPPPLSRLQSSETSPFYFFFSFFTVCCVLADLWAVANIVIVSACLQLFLAPCAAF